MSRKKKGKAKATKQSQNTTKAQFSGKLKKILVKTLGSSFGLALLFLLLALILDQFPVHRDFSIETTAKGFGFLVDYETEKTPMQITAHSFLKTLTASAQKLGMTTKEFVILETNEPELKGIARAQQLKVESETTPYYHVENLEDYIIPTILSIYAQSDEAKLKIALKEKDDEPQKLVTIELPPGQANVNMSTKRTTLRINDAKVQYGSKMIAPRANEIRITGNPLKIDIDMEASKGAEIKLHVKEGTTSPLQLDNKTIQLITNLEFLRVSEETKIYLGPNEKIVIKDRFIEHPDINIKGRVKEIRTLETTDEGIKSVIKGEYVTIESVDENTALDEVLRFIDRVWKYIKELI